MREDQLDISAAQATLRQKHINGGPGVILSGLAWSIGAAVYLFGGYNLSILCFFVAGMLIYPVSGMIEKRLNPDPVVTDKGLTRLALMTLPLLFGGLYIAYLTGQSNPHLFYPVIAIAIGLRYLVFQRVYGLNSFWLLGGGLALIGGVGFFTEPAIWIVPTLVSIVELIIGVTLTRKNRGES